MDNENNAKKGLPQELPEELLADVGGGGKYSGKGYKVLYDYYGICEKYQYRYHGEEENENPDDCLRCRYFRIEDHLGYNCVLFCTYPDDYTFRYNQ